MAVKKAVPKSPKRKPSRPAEAPQTPAALETLPIEALTPHPDNPRTFPKKDKDDPTLRELAESIASVGLLEPILVRPSGEGYQILAGERRWRASRLAGLETITAIVRELDDTRALEVLVTENLQRESLHPLEEARGIRALIDRAGWTASDVADRLGKSPAWVSQRSRLTTLSEAWKKAIDNPECAVSAWPIGHLLLIAKLEPAAQDALAAEAEWFNEDSFIPERDEVSRAVADTLRTLRLAPWKLTDDALLPEAGACASCRKRSTCHPGLFEDDDPKEPTKTDRCLDRTCWNEKTRRFLAAKEEALRDKHSNLVMVHQEYVPHGESDGALKNYQWDNANKGDKGALPALLVDGKGAGTLRWVKPRGEGATGRKERPVDASGNPAPKPLSERREALDRRRKVRAVEFIVAAINGIKPFPKPAHVVDPIMGLVVPLVAVFGADYRRDSSQYMQAGPGDHRDRKPQSAWGAMLPALVADPLACAEALWNQVRPILVRRLNYLGTPTDVKKLWADAVLASEALGINHETALAEAVKAIPEPKAWSRLNEDGTTKGEKPAKTDESTPEGAQEEELTA